MKICAGIVEYGDSFGLYRCLASLGLGTGGFDLAIIIHGKFKNFDYNLPTALEQTQEIVSRFPPNTIKLIDASSYDNNENPDLTEIQARNMYLKTAADLGYDWLMVIDSDEYVARHPDWKTFREQLEFVMSLELPHQIFDIQFEGVMAVYRGPRPRLFYRPGSIKYWTKHYWFVLEEQMICLKGQGDAGRVIGGIYLLHDHTIREPGYYNAALGYKEWQLENETKTATLEEEKKV